MESIQNDNLFIIFIDGPMGAGKTTASKLLSEKMGGTARVALADVKRYISNFETNHTYNKISQEIILVMVEEYLKRGVSVIVEWAMKAERADTLMSIAEQYGARSFLYRLDAPKSLLHERVKERTRKTLGVEQLHESNLKKIDNNFEKNYHFHSQNKHPKAVVIPSGELTPEQIVDQIVRAVSGSNI